MSMLAYAATTMLWSALVFFWGSQSSIGEWQLLGRLFGALQFKINGASEQRHSLDLGETIYLLIRHPWLFVGPRGLHTTRRRDQAMSVRRNSNTGRAACNAGSARRASGMDGRASSVSRENSEATTAAS